MTNDQQRARIKRNPGGICVIDFEYAAPTQLDEAIKQLAEAGDAARVLAGGTDIIVQLREGLRTAELVVDVKKIPELTHVEFSSEQGLQLGASVTCWRIYNDPEIVAAYPALADAVHIIGGWQIQSRASVGGNLCNSSPAADAIPPLIAHSAMAHIAGPAGHRIVPVQEFCTAPGRNILQHGELLVTLTLPSQGPHCGSAYQRFIPRNEMDIAVAGAASWVQLDESGERIEQARIALAAVAPTPVFAAEASEWLIGQTATEEVFAEAGELAKRVASPIDDMRGTADYRTHLVGVLTKRTLATACERART
jgi:carbon-monoxide dehydrogenase medium subunit